MVLRLDCHGPLTPKFKLGGGIGINGALSVGASGEAALPIVLVNQEWNASENTMDYFTNVSATGEMKLNASALFVFKAEKSIAKGEWQILRYYWNTGETEWFDNHDLSAMAAETDILNENSYGVLDRAYLGNRGEWYTENLQAQAFSDSMVVMQSGILPTSDPRITMLPDGRAIMVFQDDSTDRSTLNRAVLKYSVYENGVWSEPKAVWDNGTADAAAFVVEGPAGVYVVWQKMNAVMPDSVSLADMAAASEIAAAKFNVQTGLFEEQQYVTDDMALQMIPAAAVGDEGVTAVYVENDSNALFGGGTTKVIAKDIVSGKATTLYSGSGYISSLDAVIRNGSLEAAMCVDTDGDMNTLEDTEIYLYRGGSLQPLTKDDISQVNVQYRNGRLYWYENDTNTIYEYNGSSPSAMLQGNGEIGANFTVFNNGNKRAVVWIGVSQQDDTNVLYAKVDDGNGWSEPVAIVASADMIRRFSGYLEQDGSFNIVAVSDLPDGSAALATTEAKPRLSTVVSNLYAAERLDDEQYYCIDMDFENNSESFLNSLKVVFRNVGSEEIFYEADIPVQIRGGEKRHLQLDVDLPMQTNRNMYEVTVYPEGETDLSDNTGIVTLGLAKLVMKIDKKMVDDVQVLKLTVYNKSDVTTSAVLSIREEDEETGTVIDLVEIKNLQSGLSYVYSYTFDPDKIDFAGSQSKIYYITLQESRADVDGEEENANDSSYVLEIRNPFWTDTGEMPEPTSLSLNVPSPIELDLEETNTYTIVPDILPKASDKWPLTFVSSDPDIVNVDENGVLTAKMAGNATIDVTAQGTELKASAAVQVHELPETELKLDLKKISGGKNGYQIGDVYRIEVSSKKSGSVLESSNFHYLSSDSGVAFVGQDGRVQLIGTGKAEITAQYIENEACAATIEIDVIRKQAGSIGLTYEYDGEQYNDDGLNIDPQVFQGQKLIITPAVYAEDGTLLEDIDQKSIVYSSSNSKVASALSIYAYSSYAPVLIGGSPMTVNKMKTAGEEIELQPVGDSAIGSFSKYLYTLKGKRYVSNSRFTVTQVQETASRSVVYMIQANSAAQSGTYYVRTSVNGKYFYTPIKIKVVSTMPKVDVKIDTFNAFNRYAAGKVTISATESVSNVTVSIPYQRKKINNGFAISGSGDHYYMQSSTTLYNNVKKASDFQRVNRKANIYVYLNGYSQAVKKTVIYSQLTAAHSNGICAFRL